MGIFDGIFNNDTQQQAANDQKTALDQAYTGAVGAVTRGQDAANTDYNAGLAPFTTNLNTDQAGQTAYANATGANGQAGYDAAVNSFHAGPGYQFALDQGTQNVLRNASQAGTLASGGTLTALDQYGQGLADQQWQQYVQNLLPFIGASTQNAGGAATINMAKGANDTSTANTLANLAWQHATGEGNAQANADLASANANANVLDFGMNAAKTLVGFL